MINKERLYKRLSELGNIGKREHGGVTRLSFTQEERQTKDLLASYMKEAGLAVIEDAAGNLVGRREGICANATAILIGSHMDSVIEGGNFDGILGVVAGIEVMQSMDEHEVETQHPIEVIAFIDEEGARFGFGMVGSRAVTGKLKAEDLQYTDSKGVTIAEALRQVGLDSDRILDSARRPESLRAYIELHIEQGKVLENHNLSVGIVSGISGHLWIKWALSGEAGHAGATPMSIRRDPLVAAAKIIQYIDGETRKYPDAVATVGKISVQPGGINIIPRDVEFTLDLRHIDETVRDKIERNILTFAHEVCNDGEIQMNVSVLQRVTPAPCSMDIRKAIESACRKIEINEFTLPSGAGHDGLQFRDICPIGMIFIRSRNGVSHTPEEWSSEDDCGDGANVLYHTIVRLAGK